MSNDEARKTLAKLLSEDKAIVAKIKQAQSEAIRAQKKLEELKQKRTEIDAKLQLLSDLVKITLRGFLKRAIHLLDRHIAPK